jgi:hypothetical protein
MISFSPNLGAMSSRIPGKEYSSFTYISTPVICVEENGEEREIVIQCLE